MRLRYNRKKSYQNELLFNHHDMGFNDCQNSFYFSFNYIGLENYLKLLSLNLLLFQVCNTWSSSDGQISDYFMYETLFSKTLVLIDLVNTPPELDGPTNIAFSEDEGNSMNLQIWDRYLVFFAPMLPLCITFPYFQGLMLANQAKASKNQGGQVKFKYRQSDGASKCLFKNQEFHKVLLLKKPCFTLK